MATCSVNTLLATNPCYAALQPYEQEVVLTQFLCAIKTQLDGGAAVDCDIATLLEDGACFAAMPPFILKSLQLQLLCDIASLL